MKRLHVHVAVADLAASVGFYSQLFGAGPTVAKPDYAKWMLDDPRVNFAISARGVTPGLDHLGIQVDSGEELGELHGRLDAAGASLVSETGATCCYARSDKHWVTDPQGLAWETFHTLDSAPTFGASRNTAPEAACCAPSVKPALASAAPSKTAKSCC
jgi:catechol 2,3-dioxygenase-like lactoylglutathione lyase family enzyme